MHQQANNEIEFGDLERQTRFQTHAYGMVVAKSDENLEGAQRIAC